MSPATHQSRVKHSTAKPLGSLSQICKHWEQSDSAVECLTRDRWVAGLSLIVVTALCAIKPSLVLVRHRKTRPDIAEKILIGGKESNQTKQKPACSECSNEPIQINLRCVSLKNNR